MKCVMLRVSNLWPPNSLSGFEKIKEGRREGGKIEEKETQGVSSLSVEPIITRFD